MKKVILICALIAIYIGSFAQTDTTRKQKDRSNEKYNNNQKNGTHQKNNNKNCAVTMTNGKMMMMVDEKRVVMDKEMTLQNGTVVMMDGTVKMKDGKATKMKEGDCIDMSGKMIVVKNTQIQ